MDSKKQEEKHKYRDFVALICGNTKANGIKLGEILLQGLDKLGSLFILFGTFLFVVLAVSLIAKHSTTGGSRWNPNPRSSTP